MTTKCQKKCKCCSTVAELVAAHEKWHRAKERELAAHDVEFKARWAADELLNRIVAARKKVAK